MTKMTPLRFTILQFAQIFLTDALTFINSQLSVSQDDSTFREIVRAHLERHAIPWQKTDIMHAHAAGNMSQDLMPVIETDTESSAGKCFEHFALYPDQFLIIGHTVRFFR